MKTSHALLLAAAITSTLSSFAMHQGDFANDYNEDEKQEACFELALNDSSSDDEQSYLTERFKKILRLSAHEKLEKKDPAAQIHIPRKKSRKQPNNRK